MHPNEHALTAPQARALLAAQMPDLAALPLRRVGAEGTDNVLFRLGPNLLLRFPRLPHAGAQLDRIARWLPTLPLPLPVPRILRLGQPGPGYPFPWAVTPFLPGHPAPPSLSDPAPARALAETLRALQSRPLPKDAPSRRDADSLPHRLAGLEALIPTVTESAPGPLFTLLARLHTLPPPAEPPVWTHRDLHPAQPRTRADISREEGKPCLRCSDTIDCQNSEAVTAPQQADSAAGLNPARKRGDSHNTDHDGIIRCGKLCQIL